MSSSVDQNGESLQVRVHGDASLPALVYLPGLHGDWTLVASFRMAMTGKVRFVELTYPRTLDWTLADYAAAIDAALLENGITHGWVLGESFGSQILWPLISRAGSADSGNHFVADGVILAGGFVRHPLRPAVRLVRQIGGRISLSLIARVLFCYARIARFRHRQAPETYAAINEFIARRTELDRRAAIHRLELISENQPKEIVSRASLPVFALTGFWDPVVPWPFVLPTLKRNCPGYRESRIIFSADHNVLGTAPKKAARQIASWIAGSA